MEYNSCFDIIGPVMVGPSSSHTAGIVVIGLFVYQQLNGIPDRADINLFGSLAETYRGHGTDRAIVGGLLGFATDDIEIRESFRHAKQYGMEVNFSLQEECPFYHHPNTLLITASKDNKLIRVGGVSLGGGVSKIVLIDDKPVDILLNSDSLSQTE